MVVTPDYSTYVIEMILERSIGTGSSSSMHSLLSNVALSLTTNRIIMGGQAGQW